jgi:hypothetical protein
MASTLRTLSVPGLLVLVGCFVDATGEGLAVGTGGATASTGAEASSTSSASGAGTTATSGTSSAASTSTASGVGGQGGAAPCPTGWTPGAEGDCYRVVPPGDPAGCDKDDAVTLCADAGAAVGQSARLATPDTTPDIALLESLGGAAWDIWTGAVYDEAAPNQFVFEGSGEPFPFLEDLAPWANNQPDNMPGESCVIITDGQFHTYECWDEDFSQPFAAGCELIQ